MKKKGLLISLSITLVIVLSFLFIYKIVPFGNNLLNGLYGEESYSLYYVLYDFIHHIKIFNIYDTLCFLIVNNMISIPNLLVILFPREMIPSIVSIVFIIKILLCNGTMYYSLDKIFKDKSMFFKIVFSLLYTFSGFMFINYYNVNYLDTLYLFPLLMYGYYKVIKEDKCLLFSIMFILCEIVNYSMFIVILFYLVGLILFSFVILDIKNKKSKLIKLIISILLCMGILSIFNYLNIDYIKNSFEFYKLYNVYDDKIFVLFKKFSYLYPLGILFVYGIKGLFKKGDIRKRLFFIIMISYLLLSLFIDPVNRLWHVNNYYVSMGYISFIISFGLCFSAMYYLDDKKDNFKLITFIVSLCLIGLYFVIWFIYRKDLIVGSINNYALIIEFVVTFIIMLLSIILISKYNNIASKVLLGCMIGLCLVINSFMYINMYSTNESIKLTNELDKGNDDYRYVDYTGLLEPNMGIIKNIDTIQGNSYLSNEDKLLMVDSLGFLTYGNQSTTCCGNIITNNILRNKYYYAFGVLNEKLYNLISEKELDDGQVIRLYESKYNLEKVIPYSGNKYDLDYGDVIVNTNSLYKTLFNKDEDIIKEVVFDKKKDSYVTKLDTKHEYYIRFTNYYQINELSNSKVSFENIYDKDHIFYGTFYVNEDYELKIGSKGFSLYSLDMDEYKEFVDNLNNGISYEEDKIKYSSEEDTSLLIPIDYNEKLVIKVNGKDVSYKKNVFNMVSIDVNKGDNVIEVSYKDSNVMKYVIVSIISLVMYMGFIICCKKFSR